MHEHEPAKDNFARKEEKSRAEAGVGVVTGQSGIDFGTRKADRPPSPGRGG